MHGIRSEEVPETCSRGAGLPAGYECTALFPCKSHKYPANARPSTWYASPNLVIGRKLLSASLHYESSVAGNCCAPLTGAKGDKISSSLPN